MADDNKPIKYLRYAIGEIILVVIGILIALQINTLKTEHNDREIEKMVLKTLRVELQKDTIDLNKLIEVKSEQVANCEYLISFFANPNQVLKDTVQFVAKAKYSFFLYSDNPNKTAFETAKSSGNLFKVTNNELIGVLASYFSDTDLSTYVSETRKFTFEYTLVFLGKHSIKSFDNKEGEIQLDDFLKDFEMENYYRYFIDRVNIGLYILKGKRERAINLMELIDKELLEL